MTLPTRVGMLGAGRQAAETAAYLAEEGIEISFCFVETGFASDASIDAAILAPNLVSETESRTAVVPAVGAPGTRRRLVEHWPGAVWATIVSRHAWVAPDVNVGEGTTISPGVVLNSAVRLGRFVIISPSATLHHDTMVGNYTLIAAGARLAKANVGDGAVIGMNAVVLPGITIGSGAIVGAGAVVNRDVGENRVVAGVPARVLRTNDDWVDFL
jgi:acetyltransferase EpsM